MLANPQEVRKYLVRKRWVDSRQRLHIEAISGGVSNHVWRIEKDDGNWVMKQALGKLKVKADWYADVKRIVREQDAMHLLNSLFPENIPSIVHSDSEAFTYVMTCAPVGFIPWKTRLLEGYFDKQVAARIGNLLRSIHLQTKEISQNHRSKLIDKAYFVQLRIDPFYHYLMKDYPQLKCELLNLADDLESTSNCLVHGDFSPKNILVNEHNEIILLDYEVAHIGNPVFDVAFCICHLILKGIALEKKEESLQLINAFLAAYRINHKKLISHLGVMLLTRMDGKSPVEYIEDERKRNIVRKLGISWIESEDEDRDIMDVIRVALEGENI